MAGTGKRSGHKRPYVLKNLYPYFGKQGFTSRSTRKKKKKAINLDEIERRLESFENNKTAKETDKGWEINLGDYKILSRGEVKNKLIITALSASKNAKEKIEKAGGELILKNKEKKEQKIEEKTEKLKKREKNGP